MIKKLKRFALGYGVWICLFAALLIVHRYIFIYGDDFAYAYWGRVPLAAFIQRQAIHYQRANGRVIPHLLVFLSLRSDFGVEIWKIANPLLLTGVACLGSRLTAKGHGHDLRTDLMWASVICLLHIDMTRQSVYWLTGSFNYVYPMFMLLLFWFTLRRAADEGKGWRITAALALFAAASVEQAGAMCLGLCLIMLIEAKIPRKQAWKPAMWVTSALAFAGILTVVCAPGVRFRAGMEQGPVEGGLFALVRYNAVYQGRIFLFSRHMLPYQLLTWCVVIWVLFRSLKQLNNSRKIPAVMAALAGFTGCIWLWTVITYTLPGKAIQSSFGMSAMNLCVATGLGTCSLYAGWRYYKRGNGLTALAALIIGYGSQGMMLISPAFGPRTQFCAVIALSIFAIRLISSDDGRDGFAAVYGIILAVLYGHPLFALPGIVALTLRTLNRPARGRMRNAAAVLACTAVALTALYTLNATRTGYYGNAAVHHENMDVIQMGIDTHAKLIALRRYPGDSYRWAMPYDNDYYDPYFKGIYGLDEGIQLVWVE